MKVVELRELSTEELTQKLADSKQELFNLRFQNAINQLENPQRIGDVKKTIARIKTIIRERELEDSAI
ncbi:MAG: 50S ribosomal protein L29 [Lachnospira sp.]|nr:50S ribosomal protein L29 [Clostridia bacterium]MBQ4284003.1 50S ribosomal protein L29 [Lachnospira sp.]